MVSDLFTEWVRRLDKKYTRQKRKVLLFVDSCAAHPKVPHLNSITLQFLPPNTTSQLQPMDQGVIMNMKVHYRRKLLQSLLNAYDAGETPQPINVLLAINMVHTDCIANCFRKAGFEPVRAPQPRFLDNIWERLALYMNLPNTFQEYATVDTDLQVTDEPSDEEIAAEITAERAGDGPDDDEEEETAEAEEAQKEQLTVRQCINMMTQVQHFLCTRANMTDEVYHNAAGIMDYLSEEQLGTSIQGRITDFFQK
ncbi:tigger transposable element-derived protein 6-like [Patiria miniata]|uniref:DDE-1 domain-containing protein n=1 Tax=Patiria miniata TaxID=46514 RepID=A0A913ZVM7_PATMI|nr:tigger transposable element-derived protein 6-like [Patiria miniata]XP_038055122.1 tigger transposable element-derived protein 6-like [Patiria miniata]XP_038055126.1 tigger transposable element-derived protein 6-like [Patiria miniata]